MYFRDIILSDHEWSDEDENEINEEFIDHDDDDDDGEILINDLSNKISQPFYQV